MLDALFESGDAACLGTWTICMCWALEGQGRAQACTRGMKDNHECKSPG